MPGVARHDDDAVALRHAFRGELEAAIAAGQNDIDDDDVAYHRQSGDPMAAEQWARIAALCLPRASLVLVASPTDRGPVAERWGLGDRVVVMANSVARPGSPPPQPPGRNRLLFVANFTYLPNDEGARWLVQEVLPRLAPAWRLDLVGSTSAAAGSR